MFTVYWVPVELGVYEHVSPDVTADAAPAAAARTAAIVSASVVFMRREVPGALNLNPEPGESRELRANADDVADDEQCRRSEPIEFRLDVLQSSCNGLTVRTGPVRDDGGGCMRISPRPEQSVDDLRQVVQAHED